MSEIDLSSLEQLSAEQQAALNEDQKAIFCMLVPADQKFFSSTFSPKDLPVALNRKAEILKRDQAFHTRMTEIKTQLATAAESAAPASGGAAVFETLAAAAGIGAATYLVATDNTAHWSGVKPVELIPALENEFNDKESTDIVFENTANVSEGTVFVLSDGRYVPALNIYLTAVQDGVEVKMGDLTSQGMLSTLKAGGERLLSLAHKGLLLWSRKGSVGRPEDLFDVAGAALSDTAKIADLAGNLKLKERAWKVIRDSGTALEKAYQDQARRAREARQALENAWDNYHNCPTCSVPFGEGDTQCRVCGTARPEPPRQPDPRQQ